MRETKSKVSYEWVIEFYDEPAGDECRDIIDNDYAEKYSKVDRNYREDAVDYDVSLIRHFGDHESGELDRGYAIVKDGVLADKFDSGQAVLKHYKKQVEKYHK